MSDITGLLAAANSGDESARGQLFAELYPELRRLAHARMQARVDGVGELAISSDGHVYGYCGCHLVPAFQVSAPITLEAYHKLAIDVDFLRRTYTFFVDGALLGKPFPFPDDVKSNVLARGSLIAYAAPDTPRLNKRSYVANYNNFSITNR